MDSSSGTTRLYTWINTTHTNSLQNIFNQTILNADAQTMTENNNEHQNEVQLISKDDGVWSHYWDGYLHRMPRSFVFPKKLTLLRSWLSWHLPDIAQKI